jgi:Sulfotransferase domain
MSSSISEKRTAILAGCGRSGSTSLFQMLAASPEIAQSRAKEPGFFLGSYYGEGDPSHLTYKGIFSDVPDARMRLEATAAYFYSVPEVPEMIAQSVPDVRIILIFREPYARLVSEFKYLKTRFLIDADMSLEAYVNECMNLADIDYRSRRNTHLLGVRNGYYDRFFPHWSVRFRDRMKVVFHDDLAADPERVLADLLIWLGLQPMTSATANIENQGRSFRVAGVQRQALWINGHLEPFFRRHPRLKATLRDAYYRANGAPHDSIRPLPADHPLWTSYTESLGAFRAQLLLWDFSLTLPDWLAAAG